MSRRPDRLFTLGGQDQFDSSYGLYESSYQPHFPRQTGPPTHFDGVAFWYRPEPQETVFEHNKMLYNQNMAMASSPNEQPLSQKHRRTRSGCFTCRHRRVKCDETRPICERCRKGNRECQFPQPSTSSRRTDSNDSRGIYGKGSVQDTKHDSSNALSTIDDEGEEVREGSASPMSDSLRLDDNQPRTQVPELTDRIHRLQRKANLPEVKGQSPSSAGTTSPPTPSDTPGSTLNTPVTSHKQPVKPSRWKNLKPAMQQYLLFHQEHITRYHYFLKLDPNDFIHNELVDMALTFEPLLYAVVGFAAYHHTIGKVGGQFQEFWKYYCQSIMLLRKWLESHSERNEAALLTILQLATFEEYLGDWASLASHHRAAHSIFNALYTCENIMATETSRIIFDWLARGDVSVSIMAGTPTILDRHWFTTAFDWHAEQSDTDNQDPTIHLPRLVAKLRLIGFDMATIHASATSNPNVMKGIQSISRQMDDLRLEIQALHDTSKSIRKIPRSHEGGVTSEDAFDSRIPLFCGALWALNFMWVDWYATEQMHKYQTALFMQAMQARAHHRRQTTQHQLSAQHLGLPLELEKLSLVQCQIYEAIEKYPQAPPGAILGCQASLALASVFLKRTPKYNLWARRKLANIERMGYIWPPSFRKRMAQLWDDQKVLDWWLPNGEHKTDLLDEIREVVEERNKEIEGRGGDERDDVREMKAVFDRLDFGKGGLRSRKDSVWSATGTETGASQRVSSDEDSASSEDEDDDSEEEEAQHPNPQHRRRQSRDSGVGSTPVKSRHNQPVLEYSNRMSGVWEGPQNAGQKLM